ncbi:outer membrane protein with beta-barrel domain [Dokdonia sp. Hel_I_63]|uniref:outer membrane beta-barrel protein n=1 Tax=Dokdonia sp. Hel_I_63 TaxID=1249996 RepID=UPI00119C3134|nr:outer membrane beta-barrel protein [Dokdonia sp. Hel_I_63]TVZ23846.1 outer membrane protein with beta-barrel domain [Dokdonia sp. Hel_I_63]
MKKIIVAVLLLSGMTAFSQSAGFGIKGGLNYGSVGDLEFTSEFAESTFDKENKSGFHAGIYYKAVFAGIFIQPELLYTKINTEYQSNISGSNSIDYELSKIDIPVLVGFNVIGPLNVKAGPSFQYIIDDEFDGIDIDFEDPENSFTVGYQLGAGLSFGKLGIDVRYEGAFTDNTIVTESQAEDNSVGFKVDARPSQWILNLSYSLDGGN